MYRKLVQSVIYEKSLFCYEYVVDHVMNEMDFKLFFYGCKQCKTS